VQRGRGWVLLVVLLLVVLLLESDALTDLFRVGTTHQTTLTKVTGAPVVPPVDPR
jgi:hypothetical protein